MISYKIFIKNKLLILTGHSLIYMKGIFLMPLLIKMADVTIYGGYILISSVLGIIFGISSCGVNFRRNRSLPSTQDMTERQELFYPPFTFQFISLIFLSLIIISMFPFFDKFFLKGEVFFSKWLIIPYLVLYLLYSQSTDYFRYTHRMNYFNHATVLYPYLHISIILAIYAVMHRLTVNILFFGEILSAMLVAFPLMIKITREIGLRFTLPKIQTILADLKLGLPLLLGYIVDIILSTSDRYIIAGFISVTAVGYYASAYTLGSLMILFPKVSGVVLPPLICKAVDSKKEEEAYAMVNYTIKAFLLLAIPFIIGSAVLARPILTFLAGSEAAQHAFKIVPIVALSALFYGLNIILSNVLFVRMKTTAIFNATAFAAMLNLVLNLILLSMFKNIMIAAITTVIGYLVSFIYIRRAVSTDWRINFPTTIMTKSIIASAIMGGCLFWMTLKLERGAYSLIQILSEIIIGVLIYCSSLLVLKAFSYKEIGMLKKAFS